MEKVTKYLIPNDEQTIEDIAKAIARDRMRRDALSTMENMVGVRSAMTEALETTLDKVFDKIWHSNNPHDEVQKSNYREDAAAAIRAMNLKLLISTGEKG